MAEDLEDIIKHGAILIDVRTPEEFNDGHIEGSINVPVDEIGKAMSWLVKDVPVVLVCASGSRSEFAKMILEANGYKKVYNGGSWDNSGNIKVGGCPVK